MKPPLLPLLILSATLTSCIGQLDNATKNLRQIRTLIKKNSHCSDIRTLGYLTSTSSADSAYAELANCGSASPKADADRLATALSRTLAAKGKVVVLSLKFLQEGGSVTFFYRDGISTGSTTLTRMD